MSKTYKILLFILVILLVGLTYLEATEPDKVNWTPSFVASHKLPFGTTVLFENLKDQSFPLKKVKIPPYEFLGDTTIKGTYLFLNDNLNFHDSELNRILKWVEKGNTVFFITENHSPNLLDTLGLESEIIYPEKSIVSKPLFNLTDSTLKGKQPFLFPRETFPKYFKVTDSLKQQVLGVTGLYKDSLLINDPQTNYLVDSIGKGAIYIHNAPLAFTNFFLLENENYKYAERALAYLPPTETVYWDQYYKTGKTYSSSPLYVLLNSRALKWAYYFVIAGSILFVLFEGKRRQRSIPVIKPLLNQTYHFTRTISGLHLNRRDYKGITLKKINLFFDYVRTHFRIPAEDPSETTYQQLAGVSGSSQEKVKELWSFMEFLKNKPNITQEDLKKLNKVINAFKNQTHGK
ncbi:DUF4350 domain-containing protein [Salinimicrobium gaetbulicola]|uniref:DUF4350 domain-containing protein n=1 Tax=Salinimicrobium gaetbulicola TaxID=999702 RepID=A0ABW3IBI4_9FLAO